MSPASSVYVRKVRVLIREAGLPTGSEELAITTTPLDTAGPEAIARIPWAGSPPWWRAVRAGDP